MAFNGTVEVISGLKPKNGANFPIIDAKSVYVADNKNLADVIQGAEELNIKEYIDQEVIGAKSISVAYNDRLTAAETTIGSTATNVSIMNSSVNTLTGRVTNLESAFGDVDATGRSLTARVSVLEQDLDDNNVGDNTIAGRVNALETALGTKAGTDETKSITDRVDDLEELVGTKTDGSETKTLADRVEEIETVLGVKTDSQDTLSLLDRITNIESNLNTEISTRANAITSEAETRASADQVLSTRITNAEVLIGSETSTSSILGRVKSLETNANAVNDQISTAINSTVSPITTEFRNADTSINSRINDLERFIGSSEAAPTSLVSKINTNTTKINETQTTLGELAQKVNSMNSSFVVVSSTDEMTDHNTLYINTADNKWYYYDENTSTFIPGGNIVGINIDSTLTQEYQAADAKVTGTKFSAIENRATELETKTSIIGDINNNEFMDIKTDANNKILEGTYYDGRRYFANDIIAPNILALEEKMRWAIEQLQYLL